MAEDYQYSDLFSLGNIDLLKTKVLETHALGVEELEVKPVLSVAEDIIMRLARPFSADITNLGAEIPSRLGSSDDDKVSDTSQQDRTGDLAAHIAKELESPINYTSYLISCVGGVDQHSTTMELLKSLSNYSWDAKAVITYAAFAISYGDFWLLHQLQSAENQLAGSIATLMAFPDVSGELETETKAVLDVLSAALKVIHCIIEFKEIPSTIISRQSPDIPLAVYCIIRTILDSASTITNLFPDYDEYIGKSSAVSKSRLLNHPRNLSAILQSLQKQLKICKKLVEDENKYKSFRSIKRDSIEVVSAFFHSTKDRTPLYNGARRTKERLKVLRRKHVLLLISDLEFPPEQLHALLLRQNEDMRKRHDYEILWLPIVDPSTPMTLMQDTAFYNLRNYMPWFSVRHPSVVEPAAIRYIREDLRFTHMPILVVLDPHGKLSDHDALPMMWIWGAKAFPFTKDAERKLWDESAWNVNLIADSIDPRIPEWMDTNKVICLYGGDDINWIRKFTQAARTAARELEVPLEMLYVGKRNPNGEVRFCHEAITRRNLSHTFATEYHDYVWYFWARLASMWNSKKQIGRNVDDDHVMKGILDLLTYDSSGQDWAVFSRGNHEITMANGDRLLPVWDSCTEWSSEVDDHPDKFVSVLDKQLQGYEPEHQRLRLIHPHDRAG